MARRKKLKGDQLTIPQVVEIKADDLVSCPYGDRCLVYYVSACHIWVYVSPVHVAAVRREDCIKLDEVV